MYLPPVLLLCIGYPPPDKNVRDWILKRVDSQASFLKRSHALYAALSEVTLKMLTDIVKNQEIDEAIDLAGAFRERMSHGQTFLSVGDTRRNFYDKVIESADQVNTTLIHSIHNILILKMIDVARECARHSESRGQVTSNCVQLSACYFRQLICFLIY
jgi:hypothetical protein